MKNDETTCIDTEFSKQNAKEVFGTLEWASKNANFISGCEQD